MFGISHGPELLVLVVIALVIFGPKRIPEIGSSLGKGIREFKKSTSEDEKPVETATTTPPPPQQIVTAHTATPVTDARVPEAVTIKTDREAG